MKADRDLLGRVIVALESGRKVDVNMLLQSELAPVPKSLATLDGSLREAGKLDLGTILQRNVCKSQLPISQSQTCTTIDGMAAVQSLANSSRAKTFGEWSDRCLRHVTSHFSDSCTRVDVLFDRYVKNSIKGGTRDKRKEKKSTGIRCNVDSRDQRIGNWERCIIIEDKKASLAHFLSTEISENYSAPPGRELVISGGFKKPLKVWSSDTSRQDIRELASDQEEADTRIVLHARDAAARGYNQVNILCRDTDVLVLLLAHREQLCQEIWIFAGTLRQRRYIPVHRISLSERTRGSRFWHFMPSTAVIRQVSSMVGKASAWKVFEDVPDLLEHLGEAKSVLTFSSCLS